MDLSEILFHHGENRSDYFNAVSPPVVQTSNFCFQDVEHMREALADEYNHAVYSRGKNPTVEILRKKLAALEGADDALVFASGCASISTTLLSLLNAGDHMVCIRKPYSWVEHICCKILPRFNISTTFVDGEDPEGYKHAIRPETRLFYLESPNTFTFEITDIRKVVSLAKQHNIITVIDNSYSTPLYQQPISMGVDLVIHSASKYLAGHSDVVAGVLAGRKELIEKIYRSGFLAFGGIISPNDAWLMIRGLRTLPLRLEKSNKNAESVVKFLKGHPLIGHIYYPFLENNPQIRIARAQMKACSGLFSVELIVNDPQQIHTFCNSLKRFLIAVSWGGFESLVIPAVAFYNFDVPESNKLSWKTIRFYTGLEEPEELIDDLKQALSKL